MKLKTFFSAVLFLGFRVVDAQTEIPKNINELFTKHTCFTCHKSGSKLIGPSWEDIAAKGFKKADMINAIVKPNPKNWPGYPPMPPMPQVPEKDLEKMADWIVKLGSKKK